MPRADLRDNPASPPTIPQTVHPPVRARLLPPVHARPLPAVHARPLPAVHARPLPPVHARPLPPAHARPLPPVHARPLASNDMVAPAMSLWLHESGNHALWSGAGDAGVNKVAFHLFNPREKP